jgi:hypothetical protein
MLNQSDDAQYAIIKQLTLKDPELFRLSDRVKIERLVLCVGRKKVELEEL